jgi:hypothetical protein
MQHAQEHGYQSKQGLSVCSLNPQNVIKLYLGRIKGRRNNSSNVGGHGPSKTKIPFLPILGKKKQTAYMSFDKLYVFQSN